MRHSVLGVSGAIIAYASPVLSQSSGLSFAGSWVGGLETAGEFAFYSAIVNDDARTGTGSFSHVKSGRGEWIRTTDPSVPNRASFLTES